MSRDTKKRKNPTSPCKLCPCCGHFIVYLKIIGAEKKWIPVYMKSWDGNPYYNGEVHRRHFRKKLAIFLRSQEPEKDQDPFFNLE